MIPMMAGEVPADREPPDPTLPARLREFHERLPPAGDPRNARFSDDRLLYLVALLRDTPVPAPTLLLEDWQAFLDLLRPHGVDALLAYRLSAWPEGCRPPAEVIDFLKRQHLLVAARAMRGGRAFTGRGSGKAAACVTVPGPAARRGAGERRSGENNKTVHSRVYYL